MFNPNDPRVWWGSPYDYPPTRRAKRTAWPTRRISRPQHYDDITPIGEESVERAEPAPVAATPPVTSAPRTSEAEQARPVETPATRAAEDVDAEIEAARSRIQRDADRALQHQRGQLVLELLPVLDNLQRSLDASTDSPDRSLRDGVRIVRDQFLQALANLGVEIIDATDATFDPATHEAIATIPVDEPDRDRSVVQVVRQGYKHEGRLLRAAQVVVGRYEQAREAETAGETKAA